MSIKPSLNLLNTAVIILDDQCRLIYLNNSAEQLLGFSEKQFRHENLFKLIEADFDQPMLLQLSEQQQKTFIEEAHIKAYSGLIICNILFSCIEDQQQSYIQLELQTSENQSHILKDLALQQQSRVSNHLIRNLAHEIKNPLGGIKGAAQLLQRKLINGLTEPSSSKSLDKYCQIIIHEAERLNELVSRLLLPAIPETKTHINIHLLIEKALQIVLLQNKSPIKITKDYDPSLPDLFVAQGQIQQCLLNLIKNAAEAMSETKQRQEQETRRPTVQGILTIKTRVVHQHTIGNNQYRQVIKIDIIDNGCGIPEALLKDIFFPTISNKNSSGLGLSIAQSLVQRHDGIIEVESTSLETIFSLYLPLNGDNEK